MKTISAKVSDEYFNKIQEMADKYTYGNRNQFLIDSVDRRMIELKEMEITRIFKPKIKMEDK
jgi:hypothetical protein